MAKQLEIYKCSICGNIVEVMHGAAGALACCGQNMALLTENTTDAATEKHVPVVEVAGNKVKVQVGSVPHPMQNEHFIEWIELIADGKSYTQFLKPGEAPAAVFEVSGAKNLSVREYCNLHGHWQAKG
ncbi:desulfoferrodoxin [Geopsychrobacter electrodiphilus]|uniref:desulfoferrodoxin n=1 Tax=Geopsychrobacter electrodiphilus TaxID=225196 RepID=UPI00037D641D|nr:desulfoferrodoxin [Geopsychrobacter electrodiphilus]